MRISLALLRKRAEHNDGEISTLEELSLHQENLERIELLDTACRHLKILYLQNNIIGRIENLVRLKELKYLNLALNNIVLVENLQGCESLEKLDLTVNFIADLTSVESLTKNRNLKELYLTGNPCCQYEGYREYVVATLTQLQTLDGVAVTRTERILATQNFDALRDKILQQVRQHVSEEDIAAAAKQRAEWTANNPLTDEELLKLDEKAQQEFWQEETEHTPQARFEMHKKQEAFKRAEELKRNPPKPKKERQFFKADGRPYNINEGEWDFELRGQDFRSPHFELDFSCYKHLDTSQIDLDVQPTYVRITIKGKVFQLALPEEVHPDKSAAQRSQVTGHLLVTLPKVKPVVTMSKSSATDSDHAKATSEVEKVLEAVDEPKTDPASRASTAKIEKLEIPDQATASVSAQLASIVVDASKSQSARSAGQTEDAKRKALGPRPNDPGFVDDDDVPPLM